METKKQIERPIRLIAKIGSDALVNLDYTLREDILESLARDIAQFDKEDEIVIVTSGAIACGKTVIKGDDNVRNKQARAAVGQPKLMHAYHKAFSKYGLEVAQLLLTREYLTNPDKLNTTIGAYSRLRGQAIPIVNENDIVDIEEIFGDNDRLSLELLFRLNFKTLINYTQRGALIRQGVPLKSSRYFDYHWYDILEKSGNGSGGLQSKLECAQEAVEAGKEYYIAKAGDSIFDVLSGSTISTKFYTEKLKCQK